LKIEVGVPVISYAVGGLPSLIQNERNGFLINPSDLNAMKKCINSYLLLNSQQRTSLQTHARETIEDHYTDKIVCEKIIDLYSQIVKPKI